MTSGEIVAKIWESAGLAWPVFSGVVNLVFWFRTPEEWVAWAERNPRMAPVVRLTRAWGFDPMKGLLALRDLANKRPPGPPPASVATKASPPMAPIVPTMPSPALPDAAPVSIPGPPRMVLDPQTDSLVPVVPEPLSPKETP